jgi:GTPase SAR1 family protein
VKTGTSAHISASVPTGALSPCLPIHLIFQEKKTLGDHLDDYMIETSDKECFNMLLRFKQASSFNEFMTNTEQNSTELDIALVLLSQLTKNNEKIQEELQLRTELTLQSFASMQSAITFMDAILMSGVSEEAKTTVCVVGNSSAGKSSFIRTIRDFYKDPTKEPKPFLTRDEENGKFLETKVLELVDNVQLESKTTNTLSIKEGKRGSKLFNVKHSLPEERENDERTTAQKNMTVNFLDFGGHTEYSSCVSLFMKDKGAYIVCVDACKLLADYERFDACKLKQEPYFPAIGTYLELITERCPSPTFFLVATKMDKCKAEECGPRLQELLKTAKEHLGSIAARSSFLKAVHLYEEIISTTAAEVTREILEDISTKLVDVCTQVLGVKTRRLPKLWKMTIDSAKGLLQVPISELDSIYSSTYKRYEKYERV